MKYTQAVVSTLERPIEAVETSIRRQRHLWVGLIVMMTLGFIVLLAYGYYFLWIAWQTGDWSVFWDSSTDLLRFSPLAFMARRETFDSIVKARTAVLSARRAAIAADGQLAPPAASQPGPLRSDDPVAGPVEIGTLRLPQGGIRSSRRVLVILLWLFAAMLGISGLVVALVDGSDATARVVTLVLFVLTVLLIVPALLILGRLRSRDRVEVRADDIGLTWKSRDTRRWQSAAWYEARAFIRVTYHRSTNFVLHEVYALETQNTVLAWEITGLSTDIEREAGERLGRYIVARTSLPLRDLTQTIEKAETNEVRPIVVPADSRLAGSRLATIVAESGLPVVIADQPEMPVPKASRGVRWGCVGMLAAILPVLLLYASGWGLERYQSQHYGPQYYGSQYYGGFDTPVPTETPLYETLDARVHAETPLYKDSLVTADGNWFIRKATSDDQRSWAFKDGAYQLSGTDKTNFSSSWAPPVFGDVAVEVTARQLVTVSNDGTDGVGLILRAGGTSPAAPDHMVIFTVDSAQNWWLWRYQYVDPNPNDNWNFIGFGRSSAIRTGPGVSNRLLVIAYGSQFFCYINDQFVGASSGAYSESGVAHAGHAGVFLFNASTTGAYSDFAVYPAPSLVP